MKNVLLPTDFSENSWNAITYALAFLKDTSCNFHLLHVSRISNLVASEAPMIVTADTIEEVYTNPSKTRLKQFLRRISKEIPHNDKHRFYSLTDYNFFIESIRKFVDEKKIDLIIMGTKGASGLQEYIVGSNTGDVIKKVKCTTMVVPEEASYDQLKEVAFPTDFESPYDIQTLQPIADILSEQKPSLRILHIKKKDEQLNSSQKANKEFLEDYFHDVDHSFHYLTNKRLEDAIQCFVESRDVDMMVMIAKNLNYFQQILFHSKVEKISYHTEIPFLVLHE